MNTKYHKQYFIYGIPCIIELKIDIFKRLKKNYKSIEVCTGWRVTVSSSISR